MDRLAAYYYFRDRQGLAQAVLIAERQPIDLLEVEQWSTDEGQADLFQDFLKALKTPQGPRKHRRHPDTGR